jgi:Tol biopolymer transport system component
LYVAGQLLSQGSFIMVAADTPTQRPIQVAYTTWDGQAHQLNLLDLTSNLTETLITSAREPAWSPDAIGLLFYSENSLDGGQPGVQVFNVGQRKAYPLNEESSFQTIAWSPNRAYIASAADEGQGSHLVLWDMNQNKAYAGPAGEDPAWSPEGQRLVYRGCTEAGWNISTIPVIGPNFDLSSIQRLTQGDDRQPSWSWDGQQIAFVRRDGDNQDIYVMAADGSNLTRLTDHPAADVSPAWTPDRRLLFRSLRDGQWGIYVMNTDGSDQRSLVSTPAEVGWQPDRLAVSTDVLVVTPEPPKPQPQIPAGHGLLVISNQKNNDEMTFTIDNTENKIGPYQVWMLPLKPGHYTWTASWPGKNSRTGIADIVLGQVVNPVVER